MNPHVPLRACCAVWFELSVWRVNSHLLRTVSSLSPASFVWCLLILVLEDSAELYFPHTASTESDILQTSVILHPQSLIFQTSFLSQISILQHDISMLQYCKSRNKTGYWVQICFQMLCSRNCKSTECLREEVSFLPSRRGESNTAACCPVQAGPVPLVLWACS